MTMKTTFSHSRRVIKSPQRITEAMASGTIYLCDFFWNIHSLPFSWLSSSMIVVTQTKFCM